MPENWEEVAARKQRERFSRIPEEWRLPEDLISSRSSLSNPSNSVPSILSPKEYLITNTHDATSLAAAIRERKLTAEEVAVAYCKRAAIAQQSVNCLTEIFFKDGIRRARWLDEEFKRTGRVVGPLHGVPVSLKDTFNFKGYDSSAGVISLAENPAKENALLVDILLDAGAVLYCKTNIPQTLMAIDSHNNVFGRVVNPRNGVLTAGGSSGGEGALIAMKGSPLGVGTDIGGSIRLPAMCNGLYGIKPSHGRTPFSGQQTCTVPGSSKVGIAASAGPIARSIRDCGLLLKTISDAKPWERDPDTQYGKWEEQGSISPSKTENWKEKLVIGVSRADGVVVPLPPIQKLISETVKTLQEAGHTIAEISHPSFKKCQSLASKFFTMDGNNHMLSLIEETGEPLSPWMSTRLPRKPQKSAEEIVKLHAARTQLQTELLSIWKTEDGRRVDAIICPVAPHPVPSIDKWNSVGYTSSWVLLDYPAGTLPVREFVSDDLKGELDEEILSSWDRVNRDLWTQVDREVYLGSPACIQVVAPRLEEYRLFRAMEIIDRDLHPHSTTSSSTSTPKL